MRDPERNREDEELTVAFWRRVDGLYVRSRGVVAPDPGREAAPLCSGGGARRLSTASELREIEEEEADGFVVEGERWKVEGIVPARGRFLFEKARVPGAVPCSAKVASREGGTDSAGE